MRLLERSTRRSVKIPDNLTNVNQLACLVRQFLAEQQELAIKVERMQETQRTFNNLIKERLDKCKCDMELSVKSMLSKEINLSDLKREDGSGWQEFSLKIPSTSNFSAYFEPILALEEPQHPKIDMELFKMIESVSTPFQEVHTPEENGAARFPKPEVFDPQFFESPERRKASFKTARKRQNQNDAQNGPYQCRDCDKTFRQKHGLSQHLLTHESHGAFECDGCGKRYSRQESVYRHQRSTQCTKYQTLTNVRHEEHGGSSLDSDHKGLESMAPRAFLL
ncbi:unnamed protein product [Caenorhabditis sp. 36 PRJEB53466]|nr:unnamed protein product [Caenorhabditis sp. 36 PRJEB53466]